MKFHPFVPPDAPITDVTDLALFLRGSADDYTGDLLRLIAKADGSNRYKLRQAYPVHVAAWELWRALDRELLEALGDDHPPVTAGRLLDALDMLPPPPHPPTQGQLTAVVLGAIEDEVMLSWRPVTEHGLADGARKLTDAIVGRLQALQRAYAAAGFITTGETSTEPAGDAGGGFLAALCSTHNVLGCKECTPGVVRIPGEATP